MNEDIYDNRPDGADYIRPALDDLLAGRPVKSRKPSRRLYDRILNSDVIKGTATAARRSGTAAKSRREQLLDEAARELNSKGISMTSLTDVADRLGFSRASLYYYVEDREDLMFQVYLRSSEIMARRAGEAAIRPPAHCRWSRTSSPGFWIGGPEARGAQ